MLKVVLPLGALAAVAVAQRQGGGNGGNDATENVSVQMSDFDFNVGSGFNMNSEFDRIRFPQCRGRRSFCSRRNRRAYFSCFRGRYFVNYCPFGTECRYRFGERICARRRF
ncbi:hypothetical protein AX774_g417 [Zancudomyces culisetae]|uniref:Chitin-binding type-2 domain-containing protein n=1 Tax=Zancudomyces culisetae TaxID=1213189 RepID=A0A1R1PYJ9_ZANCU|nr:hypothetical protein AX774_g417 [Zancudomyces culisetae]|eukprot:OMH86036.1 hypothetical protein AX774_g417 [Zancudomyces culisetae]